MLLIAIQVRRWSVLVIDLLVLSQDSSSIAQFLGQEGYQSGTCSTAHRSNRPDHWDDLC